MNNDDATFFTVLLLWLCQPGIAWLVRRLRTRSNHSAALKRSSTITVACYYALIGLAIIDVYSCYANTGGESPLLLFWWLVVFAAPIVGAYVFGEGRVAWP